MSAEDTVESERRVPWDRVGLGVVGILFGAYLYPPVLDGFGRLFDIGFGVVDVLLPFYAVVGVLAALTGVYSGSIHTIIGNTGLDTSNTSRMRDLHKARVEAEAEGNEKRLAEVYDAQGEVMSEEIESLKRHVKPFVWVMVGSMPVFIWLYWKVKTGNIDGSEDVLVLPVVGVVDWGSTIVVLDVWLVWYFLWSVTANMITRRVIRVWKADA